MSETAISILVLPVLVAFTLLLECTRVGCTMLSRKLREAKMPRQGMQSQTCNAE